MRRIALVLLGATILVQGCTAPQPVPQRESLGPPPTSTRAPKPVAPPPQPAKAAPQAPVNVPPPPSIASGNNPADWVPSGGIRKGQWKVVVVHHSAAPNATPTGMDSWHRQRGWENGLGYHFVIGNGVNYPDGKVFVGPRWRRQIQGAHCASSAGKYFGVWRPGGYFNERGIGICLIGDFERGQPSPKQMAALRELVRFLASNAGVAADAVYGHGEITHKTECPGDRLNMVAIRRTVSQVTASSK